MAKVAIIYKSKYGTTEQYAKWIAEETGADLFKEGEIKAAVLLDYDTIVFGGCIHAGGIQGLKFIQKNLKSFEGKRIIAFAVGLNVDSFENQKQCMEINFTKKLKGIPCYFMRGAYDPSKVGGLDKKLMGVVKKMLSNKSISDMTDEEKDLIKAIEEGADFCDKKYIEEIVTVIKE